MFWQRFMQHAAHSPRRIAVRSNGTSVSYSDLANRVESIAAGMPDPAGPRPCRVMVQDADPFTLLIKVLACWRRGYSAAVLRDSMPVNQVADIARCLKPSVSIETQPGMSYTGHPNLPPAMFHPRDEALVICTSGTTGHPKLVALPMESVVITAQTIASSMALAADDRVAVNTPLGYMYGLVGGCMASLWAGAMIRLFRPRDPLTQLQAAIRREEITVVQGPPSLFRLFMGYWNGDPFPSVRIATTGGEALGKSLAADLAKAFPNAKRLFLYGMTEAGPRISHLALEDGGGQDACIGTPYPHFEWRLDAAENTPHSRLAIRGPSMFLGYVNPEGAYSGLDADGYFRTNDLVSQDDWGFLHFRGRLDRIFRSGGRLVNPSDIEQLIAAHPDVTHAVCRPEYDEYLGFVPVVEVLVRPGVQLMSQEIHTHCSLLMEPHVIPRKIIIKTSQELAESGKQSMRPLQRAQTDANRATPKTKTTRLSA